MSCFATHTTYVACQGILPINIQYLPPPCIIFMKYATFLFIVSFYLNKNLGDEYS